LKCTRLRFDAARHHLEIKQFRDADTVNAILVAQELDWVRGAVVLHDALPLAGIADAASTRDRKTPISLPPAVRKPSRPITMEHRSTFQIAPRRPSIARLPRRGRVDWRGRDGNDRDSAHGPPRAHPDRRYRR